MNQDLRERDLGVGILKDCEPLEAKKCLVLEKIHMS